MVRTINRQPYTVKQLDYGDVKYKFFNHSNWKGVCDDKNYLGVDQETFADSKNVYVDSEGILKSRPSVKQYIMTQKGLQEIYDLWTFGQWTVYEVRSNNAPALIFRKGDVFSNSPIPVNQDFRLILADEKIFVFEPNNLWYVDLTAETISKIDGKNKIYVPVTEIVTKGEHVENESPNVLTTSYVTRYLYEKGESAYEFLNKPGKVKILDTDVSVDVSNITESFLLTLTKPLLHLNANNYKDNKPLVFINKETGIILLGEYDSNEGYNLKYTIDGLIYNLLPPLAGHLKDALPAISQSSDHVYAILYKEDGPYAYTILAAKTVNKTFVSWTNINPLNEKTFLGYYSKDINDPIISFAADPVQNQALYDAVDGTPVVGTTINYTKNSKNLSNKNEVTRYKYVCVSTATDGAENYPNLTDVEWKKYFWKLYYVNDSPKKYTWSQGNWESGNTITESFVRKLTDNTNNLSLSDVNKIVPSASYGDYFMYTYSADGGSAGTAGEVSKILIYMYLNNWTVIPNGREVVIQGDGSILTEVSLNESNVSIYAQNLIGYYIDDERYACYFKSVGNDVSDNTNVTTFNTRIILSTVNKSGIKSFPVRIDTGGVLGHRKCVYDGNIAIDFSRYLSVNMYNAITGNSLTNTFIKTIWNYPGKSDLLYKLDEICIQSGANYLQASYILPDSNGQSNTKRIVCCKLKYPEGAVTSETDFSDFCTEYIVNLEEDCNVYIGSNSISTNGGFDIQSYYDIHLTDGSYVQGSNVIYLSTSRTPVAVVLNGFYNATTSAPYALYTSNFDNGIQIDVTTQGKLTFDVFDHETELSQFFVSKGKNLYINAQGSEVGVDDFKWYFPERNVQEFDYEITNLHPISTTEIAVFLQDSIYYVKPVTTTIDGIETVAYSYYKSRIPLGCEQGSDVITSYDNKYTMFATKRGFVAMSYQDFISSEEQALTFLSDTIYDMFNEWNQGAIKLFQYNFWIILYRTNTGKAFIFDMRGNSWWPIEYNSNVKKFIEIDRKPLLLSGLYLYKLDTSNDNYFDGNSLKDGRIDWFLSSQKLHLDAINYYKHIVNLTFFGYNYGDKDVNVRFNLRVINYRKQTDTNETKSFSAVDYKIQLTRTFVTRINYYKVNQVQYILESSRDEDAEDKIPVPLSLTAISLKYLVTGQVR